MSELEPILHNLENAGESGVHAITSHMGILALALLGLAGVLYVRGRSASPAPTIGGVPVQDFTGNIPVYQTGSFGADPSSLSGSSTDLAAALAAQNALLFPQSNTHGAPTFSIYGGTETGSPSNSPPSMTVGAVYHKDSNGNWVSSAPSAPAPSAPSQVSTPSLAPAPAVTSTTGAGSAFGTVRHIGFGRYW